MSEYHRSASPKLLILHEYLNRPPTTTLSPTFPIQVNCPKMPVELRKRKAAEPAPAPPAKKKNPVAKAAAKVKEAITGSTAPKANGTTSSKVAVGQNITLEGFGGEIETHDGQKTSLKKLVDESKAGVVLFTYPKASTPGCEYSI